MGIALDDEPEAEQDEVVVAQGLRPTGGRGQMRGVESIKLRRQVSDYEDHK